MFVGCQRRNYTYKLYICYCHNMSSICAVIAGIFLFNEPSETIVTVLCGYKRKMRRCGVYAIVEYPTVN